MVEPPQMLVWMRSSLSRSLGLARATRISAGIDYVRGSTREYRTAAYLDFDLFGPTGTTTKQQTKAFLPLLMTKLRRSMRCYVHTNDVASAGRSPTMFFPSAVLMI